MCSSVLSTSWNELQDLTSTSSLECWCGTPTLILSKPNFIPFPLQISFKALSMSPSNSCAKILFPVWERIITKASERNTMEFPWEPTYFMGRKMYPRRQLKHSSGLRQDYLALRCLPTISKLFLSFVYTKLPKTNWWNVFVKTTAPLLSKKHVN